MNKGSLFALQNVLCVFSPHSPLNSNKFLHKTFKPSQESVLEYEVRHHALLGKYQKKII